MKQMWSLSTLLIILIILVSTTFVSSANSSVQAEDKPDLVKRVYGIDYSEEVYSDVTLANYIDFVQKITENGSRWIMDYGMTLRGPNMYARNYIIQQLKELSSGRIVTEVIGSYMNVIGKLPGYLPGNNPAFAITAHYDSAQRSPGANCDGSGIAAVLELARVLSKYEWPLDIYFIAFNGLLTELGMEGSPQVATEFNYREIELLMLYNIDTILVQDPTLPIDERVQFGYATGQYHNGRYWAELARELSNNIGQNVIAPVPSSNFYLWTSSDHYAFYERGFSNVMCAFESGSIIDNAYQSTDDRWTNREYNYILGRETTAVIGASIAFTMSRAIGVPQKTNFDFLLGSGSLKQIYITISAPTIINITSRWFGGISSFYLFDPANNLIVSKEFNHSSAWMHSEVFSQPVTQLGQYKLIVYNSDYRSVGYEVSIAIETDIDGNEVLDSQEYWINNELFDSDQDSDGLSDAEEYFFGTNLLAVDSDSDAMSDKYEVDNGFDPRDPTDGGEDADSDGLTNAQEYSGGLNPHSADSDNDLIPDLWELEHGLNPLMDDANLDLDGDGYSNLEEYLNETDPQVPQTLEISIQSFMVPILLIATIGVFVYISIKKRQLTLKEDKP